jgi:hypothetical protein
MGESTLHKRSRSSRQPARQQATNVSLPTVPATRLRTSKYTRSSRMWLSEGTATATATATSWAFFGIHAYDDGLGEWVVMV